MKSKIISVVKHTVEKNIRNKWFIVLNVLLLIVSIVAFNFNTVSNILKNNNISFGEKTEIIIYDEANLIYDNLTKMLEGQDINLTREENLKEYSKDELKNNQIVVQVKNTEKAEDISAKVISQEGVSATYINYITEALSKAKIDRLSKEYNLTLEDINKFTKTPNIERVMLSVDNKDADAKYGMQTIFNYLIFFILLLILSKIANDVSQEKISKSIEYVLTSISAKGYLIAKVLSINLTFIIQFIFTVVYLLIGLFLNSVLNMYFVTPNMELNANIDLSVLTSMIDTNMVIYFLVTFVYLIFTILILSVIQAVLSSKTTNISEAGNATILLVVINLIVYILSTFFVTPLKAPTAITYILSCIPIVSMYFVPTMILIGQANIIQVEISTIILIVSVVVIFQYGAIWFKNGVLDYSNKKKDKKQEETIDTQKQELIKREYSKIGYVIGFSVLLFIVLQIGLPYILSIFTSPINNLFNGKISLTNISTILRQISFILSLLVPALFVYSYVDKKSEDNLKQKKQIEKLNKKINIKESIKYVLMALPIVAIIQIVLSIILEKLGLDYEILNTVDILNLNSNFGTILAFIEIAVLPAIFEELYVRGAMLKFTKKYGAKFAIITTSLLFAIVHLNISQSVFAFLMGIILSIVTLKTGNILASSMIHLLNNGYAILLMIFENSSMSYVINVIYLLLIILGVLFIIIDFIKNKEKIKKIKNINKKTKAKITKNETGIKKYRYIAYDYTFILACILCTILLFTMQRIITILS